MTIIYHCWYRLTPSYALILALTATWFGKFSSGPIWMVSFTVSTIFSRFYCSTFGQIPPQFLPWTLFPRLGLVFMVLLCLVEPFLCWTPWHLHQFRVLKLNFPFLIRISVFWTCTYLVETPDLHGITKPASLSLVGQRSQIFGSSKLFAFGVYYQILTNDLNKILFPGPKFYTILWIKWICHFSGFL